MMTVSIYIYISLAVYVAYDVTVSFFTIVFGLNIEIVVSIFKPTHLKGVDSGFVYNDNVNQEFNVFLFVCLFFVFIVSTSLFAVKQFQNDEYICMRRRLS